MNGNVRNVRYPSWLVNQFQEELLSSNKIAMKFNEMGCYTLNIPNNEPHQKAY